MIYKTDVFTIEYDEKNEKLVQTVHKALLENCQRVLDFWGIEKLENHPTIKIFSDYDEWIHFFETASGNQYQDFVIGCAQGSNIFMLAYDEYPKNPVHKNDSLEDFQKVIVHEFVHICHNQLGDDMSNYSFIMGEGLATFLAGQSYNQNIKIDYPKDVLFSNEFFSVSNDLYSVSQKIVRKIADKVSREKLIEYALDYKKLYEDWDELDIKE